MPVKAKRMLLQLLQPGAPGGWLLETGMGRAL
jgi:hypothetical protein